MPSISSVDSVAPYPLPSLPPSPIAEEDLSRAQAWVEGDESDNSESSKQWKGKGRVVDEYFADMNETSERLDRRGEAYPPVNHDEAETRRVEENLRRWEIAERQRRKAARESALNSPPPSLVGDVTRRASRLWPGRKSKRLSHSHGGLGNHAALKSRESLDVVSLEDIAASPTAMRSQEKHLENPFASPPEPLSPFSDSHQLIGAMSPSPFPPSPPPFPVTSLSEVMSSSSRPTQITSSSSFSRPPPPKPLGLPPPRTPPPPIDSPPKPVSLSVVAPVAAPVDDMKETRWWHDWMCGCSEGPDRGGDHQAGRTNPFE